MFRLWKILRRIYSQLRFFYNPFYIPLRLQSRLDLFGWRHSDTWKIGMTLISSFLCSHLLKLIYKSSLRLRWESLRLSGDPCELWESNSNVVKIPTFSEMIWILGRRSLSRLNPPPSRTSKTATIDENVFGSVLISWNSGRGRNWCQDLTENWALTFERVESYMIFPSTNSYWKSETPSMV